MSLVEGQIEVPTSQGTRWRSTSGADMLFSSTSLRARQTRTSAPATGQSENVTVENALELRIGDRLYRPMQAEYSEVSDAPEVGLLPASLFHAIFVSNSEGYVVFDPESR